MSEKKSKPDLFICKCGKQLSEQNKYNIETHLKSCKISKSSHGMQNIKNLFFNKLITPFNQTKKTIDVPESKINV
jgi:hypothetical protein